MGMSKAKSTCSVPIAVGALELNRVQYRNYSTRLLLLFFYKMVLQLVTFSHETLHLLHIYPQASKEQLRVTNRKRTFFRKMSIVKRNRYSIQLTPVSTLLVPETDFILFKACKLPPRHLLNTNIYQDFVI